MLVDTECVARARLGRIVTATATATGPAVVQSRHSLVASVRCPDGYVAFAGGGYLHATGSGVSTWGGYLRANLMAADDRGSTVRRRHVQADHAADGEGAVTDGLGLTLR